MGLIISLRNSFKLAAGLWLAAFFVVVTAKNPPLFQIKPLFAVKSCTNRPKNALFVAKDLHVSFFCCTFAARFGGNVARYYIKRKQQTT
ncbi:MAG: hypothetical protein IJS49_06400 [Paludibacteraceae bacterium]|nr:hypothetical protein [Paludibacteraceae bacterium]